MSDTPETDSYANADWLTLFRATELVRAESERDEARDLHRKALSEREATEKEVDAMLERSLKAERERDEARKHLCDANKGAEINAHINQKFAQQLIDAREKIKNQAERICVLEGATNHACGTPLTRALRERDEARQALRNSIKFVEAYEPHSRGAEADQNETLSIIRKVLEETK
jgi:hypothetical protein